MKKKIWGICFLLAISLAGCGKEEENIEPEHMTADREEENIEPEYVTENREEVNAESEHAADRKEENHETEKGFSFADVKNLEFYFASGAGGWHTEMQIKADGSFSGVFLDSDMGDCSEEYPNGVCYYCEFSGTFEEPEKIDETTYSTEIAAIELSKEAGTEEIIDGILYRYSTPYGLDEAEKILIYQKGSKTSNLPEEYMNWVRNDMKDSDAAELPFYGLYNVKAQNGFSSYEVSEDDFSEYLGQMEAKAEEIRNSLQGDFLSQGDMNVMAEDLYKTWDEVLNQLWSKLKGKLSEEEFQVLLEEQRAWITKKEAEVEEAGKEVEGGSLYPLLTYTTAADLTEERVYELYELLK